jgi:hypothetical protein
MPVNSTFECSSDDGYFFGDTPSVKLVGHTLGNQAGYQTRRFMDTSDKPLKSICKEK